MKANPQILVQGLRTRPKFIRRQNKEFLREIAAEGCKNKMWNGALNLKLKLFGNFIIFKA